MERESGPRMHREAARFWHSASSGWPGNGDGYDSDRQASAVTETVRDAGTDRQRGDVQSDVF